MLLLACAIAVYILHKVRRSTPRSAEEPTGLGELFLELGLGFLTGVIFTVWLKEHAPNAVRWIATALCAAMRWLALYIIHLVKAAWRGTADQEAQKQVHHFVWKLAGWFKNAAFYVTECVLGATYGVIFSGTSDDALVAMNTTAENTTLRLPNPNPDPIQHDVPLQSAWMNAAAMLNHSDVATIQDVDVHPSDPWRLSDVVLPALSLLLGVLFLLLCERVWSRFLRRAAPHSPIQHAVHEQREDLEEHAPALPLPASASPEPEQHSADENKAMRTHELPREGLIELQRQAAAATSPSTLFPSTPVSSSTPTAAPASPIPSNAASSVCPNNNIGSRPTSPAPTSLPALPVFASPEIGYTSTPRLSPASLSLPFPLPTSSCPSLKPEAEVPALHLTPKQMRVLPRTAQIARRLLQLGVSAVASEAEVQVLQKWARAGIAASGSGSACVGEGSGGRAEGDVGDSVEGQMAMGSNRADAAENMSTESGQPVLRGHGREKLRMWRGSRWG
ncbi:hypothetical protein C8R46DRAFT_1192767 [Mycena filopes]|nr:hypothetical protein C8R46DRAFT_1192767 [Mycena filopes]